MTAIKKARAGLFFSLSWLLVLSCHTHKTPTLVIERITVADSVPSGSGMLRKDDSAYIIGDDATGIYKTSLITYRSRKIYFPPFRTAPYRIPKPLKHDFESVATGNINGVPYLLAFGSGSLSPSRDTLLMMNLTNETSFTKIPLTDFYRSLTYDNGLAEGELNIEAATIASNTLYLFNRGNNMIFAINWAAFETSITAGSLQAFPAVTTYTVTLPRVSGVQARFSGACTIDDSRILFTASLEDTRNWVEDGDILGSYIGILDLHDRYPRVIQTFPLQEKNDFIRTKLESLDIIAISESKIEIESIADNDDGSTTLYRLRLLTGK